MLWVNLSLSTCIIGKPQNKSDMLYLNCMTLAIAATGALVLYTKIMKCVCPAMRFVPLRPMGMKLGMEVGGKG